MSEDARNVVIELIQKKYGALIRQIAYGILNDWQLVEDAEQDFLWNFISKNADKAELPPDELKNYLCAAIKNTAIDYLRKEQRYSALEDEACYLMPVSMDYIEMEGFHDCYGFGTEVQELLSVLDNLDRDMICLKYGEGYNNAEIADLLGKKEEFVKKRLYRAKIKMQSILLDRKGGDEDE